LTLARAPDTLVALAGRNDEVAPAARVLLAKLDWPGRPAPAPVAVPLTSEQQARYAAGAELYKNVCLGCHQDDGRGKDRLGADLVDSPFVTTADPTPSVRILIGGKEGALGLMPPLGPALSDEQVASVVTYIRRAWGHTGSAVSPLEVAEVRALTRGRTRPWTDAELQPQAGRGGRGRGRGQ
jgi:mono/diheme cytochrome c family protein